MTVGEMQALDGGDVMALTFPVWMLGLAVVGVILGKIAAVIAYLLR